MRQFCPGQVYSTVEGLRDCWLLIAAGKIENRKTLFFPENLRNPARGRRAGLMGQFCPGQVYSTKFSINYYMTRDARHDARDSSSSS
jgi:hypothetical protein